MATGVGSGGIALAAEAGDKLGECLLEAAALYDKRKAPVLLCEALLRYARHLSSPNLRAGPPGAAAGDGGARAGAARAGGWSSKEVCAVLAKVEVQLGSMQAADQVMVLGAMAHLSENLGCQRKVAYYLYRAARAHATCSQWALAHDILLLAAGICGLDARKLEPEHRHVARILSPRASAPRETLAKRGEQWVRGGKGGGGSELLWWGWFSLQASIMGDLMHFAQMLSDDARVARYCSYWLSRVTSPSHTLQWAQAGGGDAGTAVAMQRMLLNQLFYRSSVFLGSLSPPTPGGPILRSIYMHLPADGPRIIANPARAVSISQKFSALWLYIVSIPGH
jgi:hypothetical protein